MADFHQTGIITTLHRLGSPGLERLEGELETQSRKRPVALVLPALYAEFEGQAMPRIVSELAKVRYLDQIVVAGQFVHTGTRVVLWTEPGGFDGELQARHRRGIGIDRHNPARPLDAANELASSCANVNDGLSPEIAELRQVRKHQSDVGGHVVPYPPSIRLPAPGHREAVAGMEDRCECATWSLPREHPRPAAG